MPEADSSISRDSLLGGRVTLLQPRQGYRAAIDPVLLAAAVPAKSGDRVLDVGSGSGAAALALAARVAGARVVGLDADRAMIRLAERSAAASRLADRVEFVAGDLLSPPSALRPAGFDHVMANPPYTPAGGGNTPAEAGKRAATVEGRATLADWLAFALAMVRPGGTVTVIHRFDRRGEVTAGIADGAGDAVVFPLWPKRQGQGAKRVIVQATKGATGATRTAAGLVLHRADSGYTAEAEAVLRGARALKL
ncbi:MAG: methyltransferase domain-containing protein [Rhodospirillales bacterium]|nr:methyltransferase domain-containing protein [Rhodospirillales bacterium]